MRRRGVDASVTGILEELDDEDDVVSLEDSVRPLMRRPSTKRLQLHTMSRLRSIWYEFCMDLGAERLVVVLIIILCVSLYLAYMVTGLAKHRDTRIPVEANLRSVEL